MFDDQDRQYFARRVAECRQKEAKAFDPVIRKIHHDMADEYERRARGVIPKPVIRVLRD